MQSHEISLCAQLYEASLTLLDIYGTEPSLCEAQVRNFMRSQPYRDFLLAEILRISLQQNYVPCEEGELAALSGYAHIMAEVMLRGITKADYTQRNCDISKRKN